MMTLSPVRRLRASLTGLQDFLSLSTRLARHFMSRFHSDVVRLVIASAASLACQLSALGGLYVYLRALEQDQYLLGFAARSSPVLFILVALVTLVLLLGFAVLQYRVNMASLGYCREYQSMGTDLTLSLSSRLPRWFDTQQPFHIDKRHLRQLINIDLKHRSRMMRTLLMAVIPFVRLLLCAALLFYTNAQFSLVIFFVVGIPVLGLYSVSRRIADTMTTRETSGPSVFSQQYERLTQSWGSGEEMRTGTLAWDDLLGPPDSNSRQFYRRLGAKAQARLLMGLANSLGIVALLVMLALWAVGSEQTSWSMWLAYLIVLRYFLASLSSLSSSIVQCARFKRQVQRYMDFELAASRAVDSGRAAQSQCPADVALAYKGSETEVDMDEDELEDD